MRERAVTLCDPTTAATTTTPPRRHHPTPPPPPPPHRHRHHTATSVHFCTWAGPPARETPVLVSHEASSVTWATVHVQNGMRRLVL